MGITDNTRNLLTTQPETGMGFQVIRNNQNNFFAVFNGVRAFEINPELLTLNDIEEEIDQETHIEAPIVVRSSELPFFFWHGIIDPNYAGNIGPFPLIKKYTLKVPTNFYRIICHGPNDFRYNKQAATLSNGTYLTTELDKVYANTGFAVVGRYALPVPLPARYCIQYELPVNTIIKAGTVAPNFGQAGGGVEVLLVADAKVTRIGFHKLPDF